MTSMFEAMKNKLQGRTYHNNLLGMSLPDLLRQATSKTLTEPDEELNGMVVETIQQEVAGGKSSSDIVNLLRKRLQMDNPQKQWLAVILVGMVMQNCQAELGGHQEELLTAVAHVFARPAKPDTEAAKKAKAAAKELLKKYGSGGAMAFRNANQAYRQNMPPSATAAAMPQMGLDGGYAPAAGGGSQPWHGAVPPQQAAAVQEAVARNEAEVAAAERESIVDEVKRLIEQAKVNTELLGEMLVNTSTSTDEFEKEIMRDLVNEVREIRTLLGNYVEQIGSLGGPESEILMCQALEATDMLDSALALEKDVGQNLAEANTHPALINPSAGAGTSSAGSPAAPPPSYAAVTAAPAPPPPPPPATTDLIALDDLADAMTTTNISGGGAGAGAVAPGAATVYDPFAASDFMSSVPAPWQQPAPQYPPAPPVEAHATAFPPSDFSTLQAPAYGGVPPQQGYQQPPAPGAFPPSTFPTTTPGFDPSVPHPQQYGTTASPPHQQSSPPQYAVAQQYGSPAGAAPPQYGSSPANMFGQDMAFPPGYPAAVPAGGFGAAPQPHPPYGSPPPAFPATSSNPFAAPSQPTPVSSNPFASLPATGQAPAAPPAGKGPASTIDVEWDLFFADRAGAGAPQQQ